MVFVVDEECRVCVEHFVFVGHVVGFQNPPTVVTELDQHGLFRDDSLENTRVPMHELFGVENLELCDRVDESDVEQVVHEDDRCSRLKVPHAFDDLARRVVQPTVTEPEIQRSLLVVQGLPPHEGQCPLECRPHWRCDVGEPVHADTSL